MLSPEERNLLENAKALISEIESMQEGEETMEEEEIEMQIDDEDEEKKKRREEEEFEGSAGTGVKKQESEGTTASDTADERIEDVPEQTEENVDEVAKSIVELLGNSPINKTVNKPVKKSLKPKSENGENRSMLVAMNALTKVVKSLADNQNEQDKALSSILEGFGVADAVKTKEVEKSSPVLTTDLAKVLHEVNKSLKSLNQEKAVAQPEQVMDRSTVRKSLKDAMPQLLTPKL